MGNFLLGFCSQYSQYISRKSHGSVPKNSKQFWYSGEKTGSGGKLPPPPLATRGLSYLTVERGGGGVASLVVHRSDEAPLVRLGRISLRRVLTHVTVVSSHRVDTSVEHCHAHVAPARTVAPPSTVGIAGSWGGVNSALHVYRFLTL